MNKFLTLCVALAALVSSFAFAAPPAVPPVSQPAAVCLDKDSDGYVDVNMSNGCVLPAGKKLGDCDDTNAAKHPGAFDVANDTVDQDCDGSDWVENATSLAQLRAFGINHDDHKKVTAWMRDVAACDGSGHCTVVYTAPGHYQPADDYDFASIECNKPKVVIKIDDPKYVLAKRLGNLGCKKPAVHHSAPKAKKAPVSADASAPDTKETPAAPATPVKGAKASTAQVAAVQATADKALKAADDAKEVATKASVKVDTFSAAFAGHTEQLDNLTKAVTAETTRATTRENEIEQTAVEAKATAERSFAASNLHQGDITKLQAKGAFLEGFVGGGSIIQRDLEVSKNHKSVVVRESFAPSIEFGVNAGLETTGGRWNAFGALVPSWDNGESNVGGVGGAEYTWRLGSSNSFLGAHLLYQRHNSGGNVVFAKAVGNGYGGGVTFVSTSSGEGHYGVQARLSVLNEDFGTDTNKVSVQSGPVLRLMFDVLGGISLAGK